MAMEADEGDVWAAVTTSPSVSPPPPSAAAISTALSLNTRLHHLAASGGSPFHPGGGCYGSVAASPSSFSSAAASFPRLALLDAGPARRALEREMCLGHGAAVCPGALGAGAAAPVDRRKKRLMKNRESASRSRARKQTHVTQIESEVLQLREENEQLRLKYDQGFSGGVGAGEEDPAEGALGALLILPDDRDRGSSFCHHHHHHDYYSHS